MPPKLGEAMMTIKVMIGIRKKKYWCLNCNEGKSPKQLAVVTIDAWQIS